MDTARFFKKPAGHVRLEIGRVLAGFRVGMHRSVLNARGLEFKGLRPYDPSDSPSQIDWGASARVSEDDTELISREYEPERKLSVLCLVDASVSMDFPPKKQECAAFLVWLFASSAMKHQDGYQLVFFSPEELFASGWVTTEDGLEEFIHDVAHPRDRKKRRLHHRDVAEFLEDIAPCDTLVVLVSDFCGEWWQTRAARLRDLLNAERNVHALYFALDEWSGFEPVPFSAHFKDPRSGFFRSFSLRNAKEVAEQQTAQRARFATVNRAVRTESTFFLPLPIFGNVPREVHHELLKLGFE